MKDFLWAIWTPELIIGFGLGMIFSGFLVMALL